MTSLEMVLFVVALGANLVAGALGLLGRGTARGWRAVLAAGAGALLLLVVDRWRRSGHPPLMGTYEAALADVLVLDLLCLTWAWLRPPQARLPASLGLAGAALLAHGAFFPTAPVPLTISERSLWVDLHAALAYLALALDLASATASIALLAPGARDPGSTALLDEAQYRFAAVAYFFHTALILSGAWYSTHLFGVFWRWDPVNGLGAVSWLAYGLALHARLFFRWRDRRFAAALLLCLLTMLVLYKGVPHLGRFTFHVFDLRFPKPPG